MVVGSFTDFNKNKSSLVSQREQKYKEENALGTLKKGFYDACCNGVGGWCVFARSDGWMDRWMDGCFAYAGNDALGKQRLGFLFDLVLLCLDFPLHDGSCIRLVPRKEHPPQLAKPIRFRAAAEGGGRRSGIDGPPFSFPAPTLSHSDVSIENCQFLVATRYRDGYFRRIFSRNSSSFGC